MPPAYEVLLLNTAIPQIQAAQSGDTYVVPRDIAFSTVANLANGTNLLPSLTFSSDTNTGIYREGADALGFTAGGGTNQMVLTSTGLGIGTNNPAYKLHVVNDTAATNTAVDVLALTQSSTGTADSGLGAGILFNSERPSGGVIIKRGAIYGVAGTDPDDDGALTFYTLSDTGPSGFTEKMRLDSSGNLGLGVTPSAWESARKAIQLSGTASYFAANSVAVIAANNFFDGQNKYIGTDYATQYAQSAGQHIWLTAPSGTAGNAISFTQAMTLDASGNLVVGDTASNSGNNGLKVKGQFALTTAQTFTASGSVNDSAYYIVCYALSATCTLTLPTPANNTGRLLNIVVQSAQQVVSASSNVTAIADGTVGTAILPATAGKWAQLWCDGAYWNIIATNV